MVEDSGRLTGSREPGLASRPGPTGFDPGRFTEALDAVLGITPSMMQALADFEPGRWYGQAAPTRRASAHKGHMVRMGFAEHDGEGPVSHYRLTPLGEKMRAAVMRLAANRV